MLKFQVTLDLDQTKHKHLRIIDQKSDWYVNFSSIFVAPRNVFSNLLYSNCMPEVLLITAFFRWI